MAYRVKSQNYGMARKYKRIIDNTGVEFSIESILKSRNYLIIMMTFVQTKPYFNYEISLSTVTL